MEVSGFTCKRRSTTTMVAAALWLLLAAPALAEVGTVDRVVDGDTLKVRLHGVETTVRLYGVDAPEKKQAYGQAARDFTASLVAGAEVDVEAKAVDRYGRTVAVVMYGDQCLQEQLLVAGYAWVYPQYCRERFCHSWSALEKIAAIKQDGLWADRYPVAPWEWRKNR